MNSTGKRPYSIISNFPEEMEELRRCWSLSAHAATGIINRLHRCGVSNRQIAKELDLTEAAVRQLLTKDQRIIADSGAPANLFGTDSQKILQAFADWFNSYPTYLRQAFEQTRFFASDLEHQPRWIPKPPLLEGALTDAINEAAEYLYFALRHSGLRDDEIQDLLSRELDKFPD